MIDEQPIGRVVTDGGHVTISALASGTAPPSYQWWKGGALVTNSARVRGATNAVLNIDPVQTNDTGNYFAIVSNSSGSVTSAAASLVVSQLLVQLVPLGATGAVLTVFGQVGDVYRIEASVNFGPFTTNGYVTNVTGSAQYVDRDTSGGFRRLRAVFDHALPILYAPAAGETPHSLRAYGKLNEVWRLQATSDFQVWADFVTLTNATGWIKFTDATTPLASHRFYRITRP